jgi:hypothetical protein
MEFIPTGSNYAAQVKTLIQQRQGLPFSALVGFFLADEDLNLASQQSADGGRAPGSEDLGHSNRLPVETDGQILLSIIL